MELRNRLQRLFLIIEKLRTARYATFQDINSYIQRGFEVREGVKNIAIRTFQRDIKDIDEIFHLTIKCNHSNQYYIAEEEQSSFDNRQSEAIDVLNFLNLGEQIAPYVLFENRCKLGTQHLFGLLHAIKNQFVVTIIHQSYYKTEPSVREVEPYALKEFKGRWYVLAKDCKNGIKRVFGLDRIHELNITKKKFEYPKGFTPESYFDYCYGVIVPDDDVDPEEIVLSFTPEQGEYIASYPIHPSQKTLTNTDKEYRIGLYLYITHDLIMELLSYGDKVKVIQPQSLIDNLKQIHKSALKQ